MAFPPSDNFRQQLHQLIPLAHHHQISLDILAALKARFPHCLKPITLVEAYGPGILIIHRESDAIGNNSKRCG
ncbi:hypothetical protein D3C76_1690040 [compost metagenome]